jgi:ribonuclease HI
MGRDTESTVYAAELKGILLALQILEATPDLHHKKATIFTDNQSTLRTMCKPGNTSGQYILRDILQLLPKVVTLGVEVDFRWIPAHSGIPGNEAADKAAKEAAGWTPESIWTARGNRNQDQEPEATEGVKTLITTAKRTINEALLDDWETIWVNGKHGRYLHSLDVRPNKKALKVHRDLPRAISSILTQMRTGKIGLRAYLHKINKAETSQCTCNQGEQTAEHILLKCREWVAQRQELWAGGRPILNLRRLFCDPKRSIRAAKMMLKTGLLEQFKEVPIPRTI